MTNNADIPRWQLVGQGEYARTGWLGVQVWDRPEMPAEQTTFRLRYDPQTLHAPFDLLPGLIADLVALAVRRNIWVPITARHGERSITFNPTTAEVSFSWHDKHVTDGSLATETRSFDAEGHLLIRTLHANDESAGKPPC